MKIKNTAMKNEKYFVLVSIIAFVSVSYIALSNLGFYSGDKFGTVMLSQNSSSTSSAKVSGGASSKYALPPEVPTNYTDNKNGTITDNYTGLIWKKCPQGMTGNDCKGGSATLREFSKARPECEKLNFAGKTGWRLPTLKELQSIVNTGAFDPSINHNFFFSTNDPYWTATSPAEFGGSKFTVIFSDGSVYYQSDGTPAASRCVFGASTK